ncbi:Crp/Fnr family transcriptional regulator [Sandarakinorhabdus sp.]|uniref:Crp/Fnr family transcriptional regulator n=1 Tax=Sandarakinorhabdus sp. TaxID=1916663 RepID=UPI00286E1082|nr:Crp/Fnr family transcriptional regulator [Sandarakinorhabdus sp.]
MTLNPVCAICGVRQSAVCSSLDDAALGSFAAKGVQRRLKPGETLMRAGDRQDTCANIQSGTIKMSRVTQTGDEIILGLAHAGDLVGRPLAADSDCDIIALDDVTLCSFPRSAIEAQMDSHPALERLILARALDDLDAGRRWQMRLARGSALSRVAAFLHDMATRQPAGTSEFSLVISRGDMASLLGLTIETASRQMTLLRKRGIIALPGGRRIIIIDKMALSAAAEV